MKNIFRFFVLTGILCSLQTLQAQTPTGFQTKPVSISRFLDTVLGQVYFVHEVQEGHTLFSIGQAYNKTPYEKMLKDSEGTVAQLGEFIYIPYQEGLLEKGTRTEKFTGKRPWAVIYKERLAAMENKTEDVTPGQAVVTAPEPEPAAEPAPEETPQRKPETVAEPAVEPLSGFDTLFSQNDSLSALTTDSLPQIAPKELKDTLNVSLLLPLYSNTPEDRKAYVYLPFFEGAGLAWTENQDPDFFITEEPVTDSVQETEPAEAESPTHPDSGAKPHLNFKLYDLTADANSLENILNDPDFARSDAIMAAAFATQFPLLDSFSAANRIPLIHPISERDSMGVRNPYFIQLSASHHTQILSIAEFVLEDFSRHRILILSDSTPNECKKAELLQTLLPESQYRMFGPASVDTLLREIAESSQKYLIIPFYAKEITAVKTLLQLRQQKHHITLLAPAVWLDYPTVEFEYLLQNNFCAYATFYKSDRDKDFKAFSKNYYLLYKSLPNMMAYQGYTSFKWLLDELSLYNADFMMHMKEDAEQQDVTLSGTYLPLLRKGLAGFENVWVHFWHLTETGLK